MSFAVYPAMFFFVALMVTTAYFLLGGLPLLVLQHDTPLDARFIRNFFNVYYRAATVTTLGTSISFGAWERWGFSLGAALLLVLALLMRRRVTSAMDAMGAQIQGAAPGAIRGFRKLHALVLGVNLLQLVALVWATTQLSF